MIPIIAAVAAAGRKSVTVTISSNTANYTLSTSAVPGYVAGVTDITLVVNSSVWVYSLDATLPALTIDNSFASGDSIILYNSGYIFGGGGRGAGSQYSGGSYIALAAQDGGPAISTSKSFNLYNASYIGGGGGGGGGVQIGTGPYNFVGGGGGAGGGDGGGYGVSNGANAVNTAGTAGSYGVLGVLTASGGGGGTIQFGGQTSGQFLSVSTTGTTNGAGGVAGQGGGGGGIMIYNELPGNSYGTGGSGGGYNGPGGAGSPTNWTGGPSGYVAAGGGGGGWGGAGGVGAFYSYGSLSLIAAGAAGKGIALNGNTVNIITSNTIWGAVA